MSAGRPAAIVPDRFITRLHDAFVSQAFRLARHHLSGFLRRMPPAKSQKCVSFHRAVKLVEFKNSLEGTVKETHQLQREQTKTVSRKCRAAGEPRSFAPAGFVAGPIPGIVPDRFITADFRGEGVCGTQKGTFDGFDLPEIRAHFQHFRQVQSGKLIDIVFSQYRAPAAFQAAARIDLSQM